MAAFALLLLTTSATPSSIDRRRERQNADFFTVYPPPTNLQHHFGNTPFRWSASITPAMAAPANGLDGWSLGNLGALLSRWIAGEVRTAATSTDLPLPLACQLQYYYSTLHLRNATPVAPLSLETALLPSDTTQRGRHRAATAAGLAADATPYTCKRQTQPSLPLTRASATLTHAHTL